MARYTVMTLLYRGKIREAEDSLNQLASKGAIDPGTEARYRFLLKQAYQYEAQAKAPGAENPGENVPQP